MMKWKLPAHLRGNANGYKNIAIDVIESLIKYLQEDALKARTEISTLKDTVEYLETYTPEEE